MNTVKVKNKNLYFCLFFLPIAQFFLFWINTITKTKLEIGSYFHLILAIYLYKLCYKAFANAVIICISTIILLSIGHSLINNIKINVCFSYLVALGNLFFCLYVFPFVDYSEVDLKKFGEALFKFILIFMFAYELSSPFAIDRSNINDYYGIERVYKESFVISHMGAYYFAISSYFLFLLKKRFWAFVVWGYALTLGPRIGMIYVCISIFIALLNSYSNVLRKIYKSRYFILVIIILGLTVGINLAIQKLGIEGLMTFTSGRSIFWMNGLRIIYEDGLSFINIFGRGPKSSITFNEITFGLKIWMHNDFIDLLFNLGLSGLVFYLFSIFYYISQVNSVLLFFVFIASALFNGFFLYDPLFILILNTLFARRGVSK